MSVKSMNRLLRIGEFIDGCRPTGNDGDVLGPQVDGFDWRCHSAAELLREALAAGDDPT